MLKKWVTKILPQRYLYKNKKKTRKHIITQHSLHIHQLSFAAEKIIKRLNQNGFEAYIVGGAVRDLLLGREPKDFDIATNATPTQIRKIFRRSRIIGRRFQIVHVMIGPETIEVTTFRGGNNMPQNERGRIMHDNQFGSMDEDAQRRDFTCNSLYYDPIHNIIIDYHTGFKDITNKQIVMIGNPENRFSEDPVRILRATRLSAKLQFSIHPDILEAIPQRVALLSKEPIARLFDEILKQLLSGYASECLDKLMELHIPSSTHPLFAILDQNDAQQAFIRYALTQTDLRIHDNKPISIGFILATLLWPDVNQKWQHNIRSGLNPSPALLTAITDIKDQSEHGWGIPQRYTSTMREIWQLQPQFFYTKGKRPFRLLSQPLFRAAYDFLIIRAKFNEAPQELVQWWTQFQTASQSRQNEMIQENISFSAPKKRMRKKRHKPKITIPD